MTQPNYTRFGPLEPVLSRTPHTGCRTAKKYSLAKKHLRKPKRRKDLVSLEGAMLAAFSLAILATAAVCYLVLTAAF